MRTAGFQNLGSTWAGRLSSVHRWQYAAAVLEAGYLDQEHKGYIAGPLCPRMLRDYMYQVVEVLVRDELLPVQL